MRQKLLAGGLAGLFAIGLWAIAEVLFGSQNLVLVLLVAVFVLPVVPLAFVVVWYFIEESFKS